MAEEKVLVDTDIIIDWLKGLKWTKKLFSSQQISLYYSFITKKELLAKEGLTAMERQKIKKCLGLMRLITIDKEIATVYSCLRTKYSKQNLEKEDAIIAATALVKKLPLLTRNIKHFEFIKELSLYSKTLLSINGNNRIDFRRLVRN